MSRTEVITETHTYEPTRLREVLRVYDIHQTENTNTSQTSGWSLDAPWSEQPERQEWLSNYNRIPPYREPSRSHRYFGRPAGRTWGEANFVVMMFSGVYVVSVRVLRQIVRVASS